MRLRYLTSTWVLNLEEKQEALILYLKSVAVFGSFHFIHDYVFTAVLKLAGEGSPFSCLLYFIKSKRPMMGQKNPVTIFFFSRWCNFGGQDHKRKMKLSSEDPLVSTSRRKDQKHSGVMDGGEKEWF